MAEREPEAERKRAALLPVPADSLRPRPSRNARRGHKAMCCDSTKCGNPILPQHIAGARFRPARCDQFKNVSYDIGGGAGRDHPERRCRRSIACERHMERHAFCLGDRAQADVGRERIEREAAAAIDDHRDFRRKTKRGRCDGAAQIGGNGVGIEQCGGIVFKRIGDDRHAIANIAIERSDRSGKERRGERREATHLEASARGDLDGAIAVLARCGTEGNKVIEGNRGRRHHPRQQAVA